MVSGFYTLYTDRCIVPTDLLFTNGLELRNLAENFDNNR